MKNLVCFDVETTGLSQKEDFIIQLSMVKLDEHLQEIDSRNWYIKPVHNYEMKPTAIEKHGITKVLFEDNVVTVRAMRDMEKAMPENMTFEPLNFAVEALRELTQEIATSLRSSQ